MFAFRDCLGFLFVLIDRNNFDFDGRQFEIEKAKSNGIYITCVQVSLKYEKTK